jgi:hypothetical protein
MQIEQFNHVAKNSRKVRPTSAFENNPMPFERKQRCFVGAFDCCGDSRSQWPLTGGDVSDKCDFGDQLLRRLFYWSRAGGSIARGPGVYWKQSIRKTGAITNSQTVD